MAACVSHRFRDRPGLHAPSLQQTHRLFLPLGKPPYNNRCEEDEPAASARLPEGQYPEAT
jgi:hypothetical protein